VIPAFTSELNEALLTQLIENTRVRDSIYSTEGFFDAASGGYCFIHNPEASTIEIHDIGLSLSRIARWGGRTKGALLGYSVAQHSVMVSRLCTPANALVGLLHDASEAYLGDVISPLKRILKPLYQPIEQKWCKVIGARFNLGDQLADLPVDVKCADLIALEVERHDLMNCEGSIWGAADRPTNLPKIVPLDEWEAYALFMDRFAELTDMR
jgi:5'-deoxynucleotidase YfbR-like HD superfamily hydrolase